MAGLAASRAETVLHPSVIEQISSRWKWEDGGLLTDQAKRFRNREKENARLKRLLPHGAVSRPVCADAKNPPLSVDRKLLGTSTIGPHPARSVPAVAPHDPPHTAEVCRSAIGRPVLSGGSRSLHRGGCRSWRGVAPADVPRLFSRYFRGDRPALPDRGHGLGFAICKGIVEQHGGSIDHRDTPGGGRHVRGAAAAGRVILLSYQLSRSRSIKVHDHRVNLA